MGADMGVRNYGPTGDKSLVRGRFGWQGLELKSWRPSLRPPSLTAPIADRPIAGGAKACTKLLPKELDHSLRGANACTKLLSTPSLMPVQRGGGATTKPLPPHYKATTKPLPPHYKATTKPLQNHYRPTAKPLPLHYKTSTALLQRHYKATTKLLQSHYKATTKPLQSHYKATTPIANACTKLLSSPSLMPHR